MTIQEMWEWREYIYSFGTYQNAIKKLKLPKNKINKLEGLYNQYHTSKFNKLYDRLFYPTSSRRIVP